MTSTVPKLRLGWFTTARGQGSRAMYEAVSDAIAAGTLDAEFAVVFCNREPGEDPVTDSFFERVRADGVPLVTLSSVGYRRRVGGERSRSGAPLPAWRAEESGVMLHLAIPEVDMGPVVAYCRYALHGPGLDEEWARLGASEGLDDEALEASALFASIRRTGMVRESPLLLATLQEFAAGRRRTEGASVLDDSGQPAPPADLTAPVDALVAQG